MDSQVRMRVRTGPSFQGRLTLGATRIMLFNYLAARASGGSLIIRTEDTDQLRFRPDLVEPYFADIDWLGIDFDEGGPRGGAYAPYEQSARLPSYSLAARDLVKLGVEYHCFCSTSCLATMREGQRRNGQPVGYDGRCSRLSARESGQRLDQGDVAVVRLRFAGHTHETAFTDLVYGESSDVAESTDPVLLKSDGFPTYHLSSVVDDHAMEITHVIRANAWRSSTPKHVLMYHAFGWQLPAFAHLPILSERANLIVAALRESGVPAAQS
ncbi:MAG TPA: glutamate--tRNA ligase family protein [Streptosporangiaceae bacterium]|nr:glutamate--tRNA ligase family protein [Streptosporangiaceae bacterium]